jgi:hypothetical protein
LKRLGSSSAESEMETLSQSDYHRVTMGKVSFSGNKRSVSPSASGVSQTVRNHPCSETIGGEITRVMLNLCLSDLRNVFSQVLTPLFSVCASSLLFRSTTSRFRSQFADLLIKFCNTAIINSNINQEYLLEFNTLPLFFLRDWLLDIFDDIDNFQPPSVVEPYFFVLGNLLLNSSTNTDTTIVMPNSKIFDHFKRFIFDIRDVSSSVALIILNRPTLESYHNMSDPDVVLNRLLFMLSSLLKSTDVSFRALMGQEYKKNKEKGFDMVRHIFHRMLFNMSIEGDSGGDSGDEDGDDDEYAKAWLSPLSSSSLAVVVKDPKQVVSRRTRGQDEPPSPYPQCKIEDTRREAYSLLHILCSGCMENAVRVLILVGLLQSREHWREASEFYRNCFSDSRSTAGLFFCSYVYVVTGYCGLHNLGAICYMNSFLQQLYMHYPFRYSLLSVPNLVGTSGIDEEGVTPEKLKQLAFYQPLQSLFANLQESYRKYCDTRLGGCVNKFLLNC